MTVATKTTSIRTRTINKTPGLNALTPAPTGRPSHLTVIVLVIVIVVTVVIVTVVIVIVLMTTTVILRLVNVCCLLL